MANLQGSKEITTDLPPISQWYRCKFVATEATRSKEKSDPRTGEISGDNPMIKVTIEIIEGKYAGKQTFDNLLTCSVHPERGTEIKGAGLSTAKFRALGYETDAEPDSSEQALPSDDEVLATHLLGMEFYCKFKYDYINEEVSPGNWKPKMQPGANGKDEKVKTIKPDQYAMTPPTGGGSAAKAAPTQQAQRTGGATPPPKPAGAGAPKPGGAGIPTSGGARPPARPAAQSAAQAEPQGDDAAPDWAAEGSGEQAEPPAQTETQPTKPGAARKTAVRK
jgi:hypothetical protein